MNKEMKEMINNATEEMIDSLVLLFLNNYGIATASERSAMSAYSVMIDVNPLLDKFEEKVGTKLSAEFRDSVGIKKDVGCIVYILPSKSEKECRTIDKMVKATVEGINAVLAEDNRVNKESGNE